MENFNSSIQETAQSTNPEQQNQQKQPNIKQNHSQHNHDELDSDCEGCQTQKRQNEKLVDFYQRLDKISAKVKKFKSHKNPQAKELDNSQNLIPTQPKEIITQQNLQQKLKELESKINIPQLPSVCQIKQFSSKEIGFELAAALIQRQMKYKNENKKLQERINQLLAEKKKNQENPSKLSNSSIFNSSNNDFVPVLQTSAFPQTEIKDSLDDLKNKKKIIRKNKDDSSFWDIDNTTTSNGFNNHETTFFQTNKKNSILGSAKNKLSVRKQFDVNMDQTEAVLASKQRNKNPYSTEQGYGLNLWLYQFKAEEFEQKIQNSWMSDKNKSQVSQRYSIRANKKANQGNKSPRMANINKTSIIQKNLASDYTALIQSKKKNY